MKLVFKSPA